MKTITNIHRARLKALHDRDPKFGVIGHLWADRVAAYMRATESRTLLDYGAGRSKLARTVAQKLADQHYDILFKEYEPAFGHKNPDPAHFVTCIDVLEHVEREMVDGVLRDLKRCVEKRGLITISLRWASPKKRKTHPNVFSRERWKLLIGQHFNFEEVVILDPTKAASELAVLVEPKQ